MASLSGFAKFGGMSATSLLKNGHNGPQFPSNSIVFVVLGVFGNAIVVLYQLSYDPSQEA